MMKPWRVILAVATVALVSAAIWAWQQGAKQADATLARSGSDAPVQQSPFSPPHGVVSDPSPAPVSSTQVEAAPAAAADVAQSETSAVVEPPSVDTPEPAERKFAHGGRTESE
jgi:hypothetical protein